MASPTHGALAPTSMSALPVRRALCVLCLVLAIVGMCAGQGIRIALADTGESQEKTLVPTLSLVVGKSDAPTTGLWAKSVSASMGDVVAYHAEVTLPDNLASFPSYSLWISGDLAEGLAYVPGSATCRIQHADGTSDPIELTVSMDGASLRVGSDDLLAEVPGIVEGDILVLEYRCTVKDAASLGLEVGNENVLVAEYRKSPTGDETETTVAAVATVYCFQIDIYKVNESGAALAEAGFVLRSEDGAYRSSAGGWTEDASNALVVKGGKDGVSRFVGLGAGSYELSEAQAPHGYEAIKEPVTVGLSIAQDNAGNQTLTASAKGSGVKVIGVDAASGVASVQVTDPASGQSEDDPTKPEDDPTDETDKGDKADNQANRPMPGTGDPLHMLGVRVLLVGSAALMVMGMLMRRTSEGSSRED